MANHHQPRGNAYARLESRVGFEHLNGSDQLQPRPYSPLCVILVGLGIAEVDRGRRRPYTWPRSPQSGLGLRDTLW